MYFTYGNHWMLNVVAHREEVAAAALIRAAEPLEGLETFRQRRPKAARDGDLLSGPGKLAAAFGLTGEHDGIDLWSGQALRLESGEATKHVVCGSRIGITAGKEHLWRFVDADALRWVSRPLPK